ncbi:bZIP transcription factor HapX [Talaromyces stipitatus ATCC 10500]|uniref:BZIP transcription factor HapX n=1 Tax=Talaromyces stipitatus (strain ATCC 10500 / CBS 375.48 / QM 6759 / NRRL 1006) TaxID=441959 RepID=B8M9N9_TALSN|nr:bZIP transcription factor HapX [Talaromyces stipitatus ATCC 10500]EED18041.1 bZIP transcription factor HapX [Talaromyces stipitatus ATCC 10500]
MSAAIAPSPTTTTTISNGVPLTPALAPAMQPKPAMSANDANMSPSPGPGITGSLTSKEWVIPPRPKPGRKPATDTPPTKRKAQNRAAQRAFRERRAARVGELEEQIKKIEEDHDSLEQELRDQITRLTKDLDQAQSDVAWWKNRCRSLEQELAQERSQTANATADTVPINIRRKTNSGKRTDTHIAEQRALHKDTTNQSELAATGGEGEVTNASSAPEPAVKYDPDQMEIDFTSRFTAPRTTAAPLAETRTTTSTPPAERCGFCGDGTACICAEMADQESSSRHENLFEQNRLAPLQNYSQFTPPPSDGDAREVTLPSISQATNPCANGPGTCAQCRADPRSTLFCKTLAASRTAGGLPGGCCGGKGADGGCCQSRPATRPSVSSNPSPLTLTCADAFTTLSRHPNFSQATDELTSWLPKLHTLPKPRKPSLTDNLGSAISERPAMEVEAASVMGVLRYFDRRFASK